MNYRDRYVTVELTDEEFKQINDIVSEHQNFKATEIENVRECEVAFIDSPQPVSYTHLTLPTILRV